MNQTAVAYMNTRRPQSRVTVYCPARSKRRRRADMIAAMLDGICCLALMLCLLIGIIVMISLF